VVGGGVGCSGPSCAERRDVGQMALHIIGGERTRGSSGRDKRMFIEGVLWIERTGSPWRKIPAAFGQWNSVFGRFSRWSRKGVWHRLIAAMADDPDFEHRIVDSTIIRAHQHAAGAKKRRAKIRPLDVPAAG
jgi:putative transposase